MIGKKLTQKRFLQLWVPLACILLATVLSLTFAMCSYSNMMDLTFGQGARKIIYPNGQSREAEFYSTPFNSAEEAVANAFDLTEKIADEGIVLLKNNGVLPLAEETYVTPFGCCYLYPNYGPSSGSARLLDISAVSPEAALSESYQINDEVISKMKRAIPYGLTVDGYYDKTFYKDKRMAVIEFDPSIYVGTESSCKDSVGVVFLGRTNGEGPDADIPIKQLYDGTFHGAALTQYEKGAIEFCKKNCSKLIVVLNCCNPLELSDIMCGQFEADAILWIGGTGSAGFKSMVNIMSGKISPSGRLPDIFISDSSKNPVFANYGDGYVYSNVADDGINYVYSNFLEYEEGIYNGYRFYETANIVDDTFVYGSLDENGKLLTKGEVTYPFGYGLSYTSFDKEISSFKVGDKISITVKVSNTGNVAGKEAVQIYYTPPYTEDSARLGIEKSAVTLTGFAKTKSIEPGKEDFVDIEFNLEDLASYCSGVDNKDGTSGCYVLEKGVYIISLRDNSHEAIETRSIFVPETVFYNASNPRQTEIIAQSELDDSGNPILDDERRIIAATDKFGDLTDYMKQNATILTRADWKNTLPKSPTNFEAPQSVLEIFQNNKTFDAKTDAVLGDVEGSRVYNDSPITENAQNGLTLSDMRGLEYTHPLWEKFLDQIDYSAADLKQTLQTGYMQTGTINSLGFPNSQMRDGPLGLTATVNNKELGKTTLHNHYCSMPIMAATFNKELAYKFGEAIAQEALWHDDGQLPVSLLYAPALNIHRGPFGGRYYEYFSEDPLINGFMGAHIVSGAADNGLTMIIKHFTANNQDAVRDGVNTWMTEQALREIYLKPFEICIKTAKTRLNYINGRGGDKADKVTRATKGIMIAKNAIGATFCCANPALLVDVLRGEWNFEGMTLTDALGTKTGRIYSKMFRSGINVEMLFKVKEDAVGMDSVTGKHIIRENVKAYCYAVVNSNAMQGVPPGAYVSYNMSPWLIFMIVLDTVIVLWIGVMAVITVLKFKKKGTVK